MFYNNKFATKKRSTATTYKEMAETTFCRRSQQEQKFATWSRATIIKQDVVKTNKVSQKCCLLWERNVLKIWKKKNSNKVVRKDNLQKSYQKRPFAKNDKNKQIQNKKYQEDWCEISVVYLGFKENKANKEKKTKLTQNCLWNLIYRDLMERNT